MSAIESIATPTLPTSPSARGWSESRPICVGRSNAHDSPVWPAASRNLKRSLVDSAVPNPAYWRIVHGRPRYIDGYTPRVYGASPGRPSTHLGIPADEIVGGVQRPDLDPRVGSARALVMGQA